MNIQTLMYIHNLLVNDEYKRSRAQKEAWDDYLETVDVFGEKDSRATEAYWKYESLRDEGIAARNALKDFESVEWK